MLWVLMGGVMLLLLLVCANIGGLMIARASGRKAELAVRTALGATRFRLVRQVFCESLLLMVTSTAAAIVVSLAIMPVIARMLPPVRDLRATRLPVTLDLAPDWRVFSFVIAASAVAVLLFGLLPAIAAATRDAHPLLKEARNTSTWRGRHLVIVLQTALASVLLTGAGLTILTLHRLEHMDPGFNRAHVVTFSLHPEMENYTPEQAADLQRRLLDRARVLPDVESAAISSRGLMRGTGLKMTVARAGERAGSEDFMSRRSSPSSPR